MASPCCVQYCKNIGKHRFPKEEVRRTQWIQAIKYVKPGLTIRKNSLICSAHFRPTDFSVTPAACTNLDRAPKIIKKNTVPSIFAWNQQHQEQELVFDPSKTHKTYSQSKSVPAYVDTFLSLSLPKLLLNSSDTGVVFVCAHEAPPIQYIETYPFLDIQAEETVDPLQLPDEERNEILSNQGQYRETEQHNTQDLPQLLVHLNEGCSKHTQTSEETIQQGISMETQTLGTINFGFSIHAYKNDDKSLHFYTGLGNFQKIMLVLFSLGTSAYNLNYFYGPPPKKLDSLEQLFITLIILRRHKTFEEIAMLYKISLKHVYTIFVTWIRFMSLQWKTIDLWVDRETVRAYIPFDFHEKYPATRVIIDATECPIKKPKLPLAQQVTFSTYKNRNTIKFLVGITPGGLISYVSRSFGGYASDRHIIETSPILEKFNYNDEIMVDKGLDVQDIFVPHGVKVNMPAFFRKGNQIESSTLSSNRKIASKRVHIERVIGMLKTYKILTQPMNQTEILLSSDIVFVVSQLVNFRLNIINKNA